jgi:hypothetical protein
LVRAPRLSYDESVVTRRYPLELLKRARGAKVDATSRALSVAQQRVQSAEGEVVRRVQAKMEFERELTLARRSEQQRLEGGELTVADLGRAAEWTVGVDLQKSGHARSVDEARGALGLAQGDAETKRRTLVHAERDAELVEKHHDRWQKARRAEAVSKDELCAEESHLSRYQPGGGKAGV